MILLSTCTLSCAARFFEARPPEADILARNLAICIPGVHRTNQCLTHATIYGSLGDNLFAIFSLLSCPKHVRHGSNADRRQQPCLPAGSPLNESPPRCNARPENSGFDPFEKRVLPSRNSVDLLIARGLQPLSPHYFGQICVHSYDFSNTLIFSSQVITMCLTPCRASPKVFSFLPDFRLSLRK